MKTACVWIVEEHEGLCCAVIEAPSFQSNHNGLIIKQLYFENNNALDQIEAIISVAQNVKRSLLTQKKLLETTECRKTITMNEPQKDKP